MKTQHLLKGTLVSLLVFIMVHSYTFGQGGWTDDGTKVRLTTSSDKVGIGTDSPDNQLNIHEKTNAQVIMEISTDYNQNSLIEFATDRNGTPVYGRIGLDHTDNVLRIKHGGAFDGQTAGININSNNYVGIGTSNPEARLHIDFGTWDALRLQGPLDQKWDFGINNSGDFYIGDVNTAKGAIYIENGQPGNSPIWIKSNGSVGIGTSSIPSGYKLAVDGKIIVEEVKVKDSGSWPDHIFKAGYHLKPLNEVEQYIQAHKHLPDIPSEKEVAENGVSLGDMQARLLLKVEELTLYMIELDKENQALKERVAELER